MADRLRMLGVRLAMLQERSAVGTFLLPIIGSVAVFIGITGATGSGTPSMTKGLIAGAVVGVLTGVVALIVRRRKPPALAGFDAHTRFAVGKIVAEGGGPVSVEQAPLVVRQADALLQLPYHPVVSGIIFGGSTIANGWSVAFAIEEGDGARTAWALLATVSVIVLLVMTFRLKGRRQRAAAARARALQLLGWGAG